MEFRNFYVRCIFPHFMDLSMRSLSKYRVKTLAEAAGEVLEVGFGTGLNLDHYPPTVKRLTALDPLDALRDRVQRRIDRAAFPVERHALPADGRLPFDDACFDCVTMTWTLCSIAEPIIALREMRRVLRPEGKLLFIEHGRSDDARVARWQDRVNRLHRAVAGGCNLNRRIDTLIEAAEFKLTSLDRFVLKRTPRIVGETYRGAALPV